MEYYLKILAAQINKEKYEDDKCCVCQCEVYDEILKFSDD